MPRPGQPLGTSDCAPPQHATEEELSRTLDMLEAAKTLGLEDEVWKLIPEPIRLDFNWSKWHYQPRKE